MVTASSARCPRSLTEDWTQVAGQAKSVQDRRVHTRLTLGSHRDRRPGHSPDRTVCGADRPHHPLAGLGPVRAGPAAGGDRRRAGLPGGGAGAAALRRRAALAARGCLPGRAPVPPAAAAKRIQRPAAGRRAADGGGAAVAGQPHAGHRGAGAAAGCHPRPVRPVRGHRPPFGAVWLGRIWLLPQPFALVLGIQADADLHLRGDGDRVLPGQPETGWRARPGPADAHSPARPAPGTVIVTDKGLAGEGTEEFFAHPGLDLALIRPARKDEPHRPFPNWLRQGVEAIIWTLKNP